MLGGIATEFSAKCVSTPPASPPLYAARNAADPARMAASSFDSLVPAVEGIANAVVSRLRRQIA